MRNEVRVDLLDITSLPYTHKQFLLAKPLTSNSRTVLSKCEVTLTIIFNDNSVPLLIAEISANHNGNKKRFLNHIKLAHKNGADLIKIQTYEEQDITLPKYSKKFTFNSELWKDISLRCCIKYFYLCLFEYSYGIWTHARSRHPITSYFLWWICHVINNDINRISVERGT